MFLIGGAYSFFQFSNPCSFTAPVTSGGNLSLTPEDDAVLVGNNLGVYIRARSDLEIANLFVVKLTFDPALFEAVDINTSHIANAFIINWLSKKYDNQKGTVVIKGEVPSGFHSFPNDDPVIAMIVFRAKALGSLHVSLSNESGIYRYLNSFASLFSRLGKNTCQNAITVLKDNSAEKIFILAN